ncbi:hypothetical protein RHECIAT_CH0001065 [Rhizobium etli CIAT 652]|uniref:Uncharacterized protein n=1 Tax=Rhizobium etli (strain CIAT 652) TaxID=491916 RepID=B3PSC8_RHIE6|nr:hypothetical protein RHECIAT_CH0001065 [Rhizobium etli CIAT 652]
MLCYNDCGEIEAGLAGCGHLTARRFRAGKLEHDAVAHACIQPYVTGLAQQATPPSPSSGLTRRSTPAFISRAWIPGSRPGMTEIGENHEQDASDTAIQSPTAGLPQNSPHPSSSGLTQGSTLPRWRRSWIAGSEAWNDGDWGCVSGKLAVGVCFT